MLHAPDFLSYPDAIQMARDHGEMCRGRPYSHKTGNEISRVSGARDPPRQCEGRKIHRVPTRGELAPLAEQLKPARDLAVKILQWASGSSFLNSSGITKRSRYATAANTPSMRDASFRIAASISAARDYDKVFEEAHVADSTALQQSFAIAAPISSARWRGTISISISFRPMFRRLPRRRVSLRFVAIRSRAYSCPRRGSRPCLWRSAASHRGLRKAGTRTGGSGLAVRRNRPWLHRGSARHMLSSLRDRR